MIRSESVIPSSKDTVITSDGVKDMTREAKAKAMMTHKAKDKDLTWHGALKPQTLYTVQC